MSPCRFPRAWLVLVVVLALAPPLPAQSVDSTAAVRLRTATAKLDSAVANTQRYCRTSKPVGYQCPTALRQETEARAIVAGLAASWQPAPPPVVQPPPPPVVLAATVAIHSNGTSVPVGGTLPLYAEPKSAAGVTLATPVAWSVREGATYGSVSGVGVLTGKQAGTVTVMAKADTATVTRVYTVTGTAPQPPPADSTPTTPPTPPPPPVVTTPPPAGIESTTVTAGPARVAELPRALVDFAYPAAQRVVQLPAGGDLQAAMNACTAGTELRLPPGAAWTGNYQLPARNDGGWCTIRADLTDAQLGPPGTRMTPSRAATLRLPKITSTTYDAAVWVNKTTWRVRLVGVELYHAASDANATLRVDANQTTLAQEPRYIILDRSYVHVGPTSIVRRCVMANGGDIGVVDSWLAGCQYPGGDAQAFVAWNGSGPFTIQNSHLEASHEVVMFGGADPAAQALQPADATLIGNHILRPPNWPDPPEQKNLLETKNIKRYLIQGNRIENVRASAQAGFAFVWKSENQNGTAPYTTSSDITFRWNDVRNVGNVFNLSGKGSNPTPNVTADGVTIVDNVFTNINQVPWTAQGIIVQLLSGVRNVLLAHNSFVNQNSTSGSWSLDGGPFPGLSVHSNAFLNGPYGVKGSGLATGKATLDAMAPGYLFQFNVIGGASCAQYPATNLCPATLPATMPAGLDGRAIGADIAKVARETAGAVVAP